MASMDILVFECVSVIVCSIMLRCVDVYVCVFELS